MQAIILSVGDELVLGQTVDTNAAWLSARLAECGILTRYHKVIPDDPNALVQSVGQAAGEADWVIVSGGLGPTPDDLTRSALAGALHVPLVLHGPSLERIERFFRDRGRAMPESCRVQAMCPAGSEILENPCGTAPGLKMSLGRATVFAFPGVPAEMKAMFTGSVLPCIAPVRGAASLSGRFILTWTINTFGIGESIVAERLGDLMDRSRNPVVGTTVSGGVVSARIRSDFETAEKARAELEQTALEIRDRLGSAIFGAGNDTLQDVVCRFLLEKHKTVATAESCTAGLMGKLLTDRPGASAWYKGGWIVYANSLKHEQLGVPLDVLKREGAVSEAVARCMAEQAVKRSGADYSLAATGIAGPEGATPDKAVGTVWIGLGKRGMGRIATEASCFLIPGDRENIRERSAKTALNLLRLELVEGHPDLASGS